MNDRQSDLLQTHEEERSVLMKCADSYKLLTAELKTENRDLRSTLADLQRRLDKASQMEQSISASPDTLAEMSKLVQEYKAKANQFENRAVLAEAQNSELTVELEVALKRATVAENQLMNLRYQLNNTS